jgi:hypothetical protein
MYISKACILHRWAMHVFTTDDDDDDDVVVLTTNSDYARTSSYVPMTTSFNFQYQTKSLHHIQHPKKLC